MIAIAGKSMPVNVAAGKQTRDFDWPAARETLGLQHTGSGAPWAIVQSRAALPLKAPLFTGYTIKRTVTPVEQKDKSGYTRGDVYRVTLEIDAQTDMTWVVVDDPIPSGAAILGSGLGRDAGSLTQGEKREGWASPAFVERTHEAYRAYYEFVPKGRFKIEYTVRLNNPGTLRSAGDARRSDVLARDVRRAAETRRRGEAMKRPNGVAVSCFK